jgi:hypothetical protein
MTNLAHLPFFLSPLTLLHLFISLFWFACIAGVA